jgi:hypothetical protein
MTEQAQEQSIEQQTEQQVEEQATTHPAGKEKAKRVRRTPSQKVAHLQKLLDAAKEAEQKDIREHDTHAKIVLGGEIIRALKIKSWREINYEALRKYLEKYSDAIRNTALKEDKGEDDSWKRLKEWEKRTRKADNEKKRKAKTSSQQSK